MSIPNLSLANDENFLITAIQTRTENLQFKIIYLYNNNDHCRPKTFSPFGGTSDKDHIYAPSHKLEDKRKLSQKYEKINIRSKISISSHFRIYRDSAHTRNPVWSKRTSTPPCTTFRTEVPSF